MNKYDRTTFLYNISSNDIDEWDLIRSNWDLFEIKRPLRFDSIKYSDVQRPDMISVRLYGVTDYWWILCKFNQIDDVWNDLYVGMDLIIPDVLDIQDYYTSVRRRKRKE